MKYARTRTTILSVPALVLTIGMVLGVAQDKPAGPRIKTSTEIFDFGFVPQNATVSHTYWLRNTGTEKVQISQIKPNCGCTRVPPTDSSIAVGDSLPVEIQFGTRNITGKVEKFTRIVSNAQGRVPALTFRAQVVKNEDKPGSLAISPAIVVTNPSNQGKLSVRNVSKAHVIAQIVDAPPGVILIDNNEISLAPNEDKELNFTLLPQPENKEFTKSITLEANDSAKTRITVPITNVQKE